MQDCAFSAFGYTCTGSFRKLNQDCYCLELVDPRTLVFGVFDGHGSLGHNASYLCSELIPQRVAHCVANRGLDVPRALRQALEETQAALLRVAEGEYHVKGGTKSCDYGTTASVCVLRGNELHVANVGDSRCIIIQHDPSSSSSAWKIVYHSRDHNVGTYPNEKERVLRDGGSLEVTHTKMGDDWRVYPGHMQFGAARQASLTLNMSRALGHFIMGKHGLSSEPDIDCVPIDLSKETYCLCASDGLWNVMTMPEVLDRVREASTLPKLCMGLLAESEARWVGTNFGDNITVTLVHLPARVTGTVRMDVA